MMQVQQHSTTKYSIPYTRGLPLFFLPNFPWATFFLNETCENIKTKIITCTNFSNIISLHFQYRRILYFARFGCLCQQWRWRRWRRLEVLLQMLSHFTVCPRYTYRVLQTIQMKSILSCVWAEPAVQGSTKTALKFKCET